LHPSSVLPGLLAISLVGCKPIANLARQLFLQVLERHPDLLATRFGAGIREAASLMVKAACATDTGSLFGERWRFAVVREAYAEHLEGRRSREIFLDAIFAEIAGLAVGLDTETKEKVSVAETLRRSEIIFGIIAALPLRSEFELAHIIRNTARFLTLRAMPLLLDGAGQPPLGPAALGITLASVLLHTQCSHCADEHDVKRLLATSTLDGGLDQPLPVYFSRRPAPDLRSPLQEVAAASWSVSELLSVLTRRVPEDSCLLQGPGTHQTTKRRVATTGRRGRKRGVSGVGPE